MNATSTRAAGQVRPVCPAKGAARLGGLGSLPLRCHCDGRSGALEGTRGHSHRFRIVRPIAALRAAFAAVFAGLRGLNSASPGRARLRSAGTG
jgi:hypothetical protein